MGISNICMSNFESEPHLLMPTCTRRSDLENNNPDISALFETPRIVHCSFIAIIVLGFLMLVTTFISLRTSRQGINIIHNPHSQGFYNDTMSPRPMRPSPIYQRWGSKVKKSVNIELFGDSLISKTDRMYNLVENMQNSLDSLHPGVDIRIHQSGHGGDRIKALRDRMEADVLSDVPDALIIYWDSDAADVGGTNVLTKHTS